MAGWVAEWGAQHPMQNLDGEGQQAEISGEHAVPTILSPCLPPAMPMVLPTPQRLPGPFSPPPPASSSRRCGDR